MTPQLKSADPQPLQRHAPSPLAALRIVLIASSMAIAACDQGSPTTVPPPDTTSHLPRTPRQVRGAAGFPDTAQAGDSAALAVGVVAVSGDNFGSSDYLPGVLVKWKATGGAGFLHPDGSTTADTTALTDSLGMARVWCRLLNTGTRDTTASVTATVSSIPNADLSLTYATIVRPGPADTLHWLAQPTGVTVDLYSVWGDSHSDVFAVGDSGTILHYDGSVWSRQSSGTTANLRGVWGNSATDVIAVGDSGTILRFNGAS